MRLYTYFFLFYPAFFCAVRLTFSDAQRSKRMIARNRWVLYFPSMCVCVCEHIGWIVSGSLLNAKIIATQLRSSSGWWWISHSQKKKTEKYAQHKWIRSDAANSYAAQYQTEIRHYLPHTRNAHWTFCFSFYFFFCLVCLFVCCCWRWYWLSYTHQWVFHSAQNTMTRACFRISLNYQRMQNRQEAAAATTGLDRMLAVHCARTTHGHPVCGFDTYGATGNDTMAIYMPNQYENVYVQMQLCILHTYEYTHSSLSDTYHSHKSYMRIWTSTTTTSNQRDRKKWTAIVM